MDNCVLRDYGPAKVSDLKTGHMPAYLFWLDKLLIQNIEVNLLLMISRIICICTDRVDVIVETVMTLEDPGHCRSEGSDRYGKQKKVTGCSLIAKMHDRHIYLGSPLISQMALNLQMSPFITNP